MTIPSVPPGIFPSPKSKRAAEPLAGAGKTLLRTPARPEAAGGVPTAGTRQPAPHGGPEPAGASPEPRLVVVSNRVPSPSPNGTSGAGGLAVALEAALKQRGGLWFGWSGKTVDLPEPSDLDLRTVDKVSFAVMDINRRDFDHYYAGFSNRALWPICHYRLDLMQSDRADMEGYFRVNGAFAQGLAQLLRPDDLVWVHDYHFIPMASMLRSLGFGNRIGFFLHIPWPPPDLASALPAYDTLLRGLAAYDVVGFQTEQDAENFARCLVREQIGRPLGHGEHEVEGRRVRIGAFGVGIDNDAFIRSASHSDKAPLVRRMRASMGDRHLIIGVDRLDYSKGLKQRIEAFACFIRSNPHARNRVTYLQITPKSRSEVPEYKKMQHEVAEHAGWANGNLGDVDWTPIRYVNRTVSHTALAGLYRMARVGLVTPLRDGMNLVAKEYVAAQSPDDPGVLVLSRFAGAAHELNGALLVNPYDTEATAAAIARALAMPLEERKERWSSMMQCLARNSVGNWCRSFLTALSGSEASSTSPTDASVPLAEPEYGL